MSVKNVRAAQGSRRNQLGQAMGAKGLLTRRKLLEATEILLRTVALRDLRVAEIVRVAGTSYATFYVYFNDVPEAVLALIGRHSQSSPGLLSLAGAPWEAVDAFAKAHAFVEGYIERYDAHAPLFRVRNLASDEGDSRFTELRINAVRPLVLTIADRVAERRESGDLPRDLDPTSAASALLTLIERVAVLKSWPFPRDVNRRFGEVAAFFTALLFTRGPVDLGAAPTEPGLRTVKQGASSAAAKPPRDGAMKNLHGQSVGAKGAQTRARLLQATADLLATRPLLGLTVAEIAKAADVGASSFYLYFPDVPEAVLAMLADIQQGTPELLSLLQPKAGEGVQQRAQAFVFSYIRAWQANGAIFRIRNLAADEGDERFARDFLRSVGPLIDQLTVSIDSAQAAGRLPEDLAPRAAATAFLAMLERVAVTPNIDTGPVTTFSIGGAAAYFLSILLGGSEGAAGQAAAWPSVES